MARRTAPLYRRAQIGQNSKNIRLTKTQLNAVKEWADRFESGALRSESENYTGFQQYILHDLLGYENTKHECDNIDFVVPAINGDDHTLVVECKNTGTDLDKRQHGYKEVHRTPMSQLWDYMRRGEWGIVTNYRLFRLVKRSRGDGSAHEIDFKTLYDEDGPDHTRIAEFVYVFGHIVRSGDGMLDADTGTEDREMANGFYRLFSDTRLMLVREFEECGAVRNDAIRKAQIFLNRLVFLFFAEDRNMVRNGLFMSQLRGCLDTGFPDEHTDAVCRGMRDGLFRVLDAGYGRHIPKFNGGLFREGDMRDVSFPDYRDAQWFAGVVPDRSPASSNRVKKFAKEHPRLSPIILNMVEMREYSFQSDINLNILGHVFEQSIQDLDDLEAGSVRKSEGIYYTPPYITDWICRNTILPYLSLSGVMLEPEDLVREYAECGRLAELEKRLRDLRVLDPACGSGAFITAAAAVLLDIHEAIHDSHVLNRGYLSPSGQARLDGWSADTTMRRIITDNIYGVDKSPQAVRIAQLSLFLLVASSENPLPDNSGHIISGNSIISDRSVVQNAVQWSDAFPDVLGRDGPGFDIIVGNPPYGAKLTADEKKHLKGEFNAGGTNTAAIFIHQSLRLLKEGGMHSFIVPKSLMFSSREWVNVREAILDDLVDLVDVGRVWNEVRLEQCIYVVRGGSNTPAYRNGVRDGDGISLTTDTDKRLVAAFGAFPPRPSGSEFRLGARLAGAYDALGKYTANSRGQYVAGSLITDAGTPIIGGRHVQPYRVDGMMGRVDPAMVGTKGVVRDGTILAQNIVAHIKRPADHIRIAAAIPERADFLILDTVNQIDVDDVSPYFVLGLLHSKIVNWYSYWFLFSKGVRTLHFDRQITDRIPIRVARVDEVVELVRKMLEKPNPETASDLDRLFYEIFEMSPDEIQMVEASFGDDRNRPPDMA